MICDTRHQYENNRSKQQINQLCFLFLNNDMSILYHILDDVDFFESIEN